MGELGEFFKKFVWRGVQLTQVPAVVNSKPAQFLWHSPALKLTREWSAGVLLLLILGIGVTLPISRFDQTRARVGNNFRDYWGHLQLAEISAEESDFILADKELRLANQLVNATSKQGVLGVTSEFARVTDKVFPREAIYEEIAKWEEVLAQKLGYRDVLLRLAVLHWQIYEDDTAREYFEEARALDPNNEVVKQVGKLIEADSSD